ncbi:MAG: histidine phosphatase family protein [Bacteroidales bacterium]|nr:histidine phosphatase family protein [Bacteroidales bacterium]
MKNVKTLHVLRHAKSSWDYDSISDIDRPLKLRGIKNAYEMARRMKIRNSLPEIILSSPANRAFHTANIFSRVFEFSYKNLRIEPKLYESSEERILALVKGLEKTTNSAMIFGHNPDFTNFVNLFIDPAIINIPTCGLVTLEFSTDSWENISMENLKSHHVDFPKNG